MRLRNSITPVALLVALGTCVLLAGCSKPVAQEQPKTLVIFHHGSPTPAIEAAEKAFTPWGPLGAPLAVLRPACTQQVAAALVVALEGMTMVLVTSVWLTCVLPVPVMAPTVTLLMGAAAGGGLMLESKLMVSRFVVPREAEVGETLTMP